MPGDVRFNLRYVSRSMQRIPQLQSEMRVPNRLLRILVSTGSAQVAMQWRHRAFVDSAPESRPDDERRAGSSIPNESRQQRKVVGLIRVAHQDISALCMKKAPVKRRSIATSRTRDDSRTSGDGDFHAAVSTAVVRHEDLTCDAMAGHRIERYPYAMGDRALLVETWDEHGEFELVSFVTNLLVKGALQVALGVLSECRSVWHCRHIISRLSRRRRGPSRGAVGAAASEHHVRQAVRT